MIPYSAEVLFAVLAEYNRAVWPVQAVFCLAGAAVIALALRPRGGPDRAAAAVLTLAWGWTGGVYHLAYFTDIDFWAWGFGTAFIVQCLLMAWTGVVRGRLRVRFDGTLAARVGAGVAVFGLVVYPAMGPALGREVAELAVFGAAPAATVMVTLGLLLLAQPVAPWHLLVLPLAWCAVGGAVALELGTVEDLVLPLVGVLVMGVRVLK